MMTLSLHPQQAIKAEIVRSGDYRWIVLTVGDLHINLHSYENHPGADLADLAGVLAEPQLTLAHEEQSARHDAEEADKEAARGLLGPRLADMSNGLPMGEANPYFDEPTPF